jgi:hypothetical protein
MKPLEIRVVHQGSFPVKELQNFFYKKNILFEIINSNNFFNKFFKKNYSTLLLTNTLLAPHYFFDGCPQKWIVHYPKVDRSLEGFYFRNYSNIVFSEEDKNYLQTYTTSKKLIAFDPFCKDLKVNKKIKETLPISVFYSNEKFDGVLSQLDPSKVSLRFDAKKKIIERDDIVLLDSSHTLFDCLKHFSKGKICIIIDNKTLLPLIRNYQNSIYLSDPSYLKDVIKDLLYSTQKFETLTKEAIKTASLYPIEAFTERLVSEIPLGRKEFTPLKDLESSSNFG